MPELPGLFIFLFLMAGTQGIILSIVLWKHKSNRAQNKLLGWIVFMFSLIFFYYIISNINQFVQHKLFPGYAAGWVFVTAAATLLLKYLRTCFGLPALLPREWLYWLPTTFFAGHVMFYYILGKLLITDYIFLAWVGVCYILGVTIYSYCRYKGYALRGASNQGSSRTKRYLRLILLFYAAYSATQLLSLILFPYIPHRASLYITIFVKFFTTIGIYAVAYLNVQYAHQVAPVMMVLPEPVEIEKYRNSTLDEQTAETIRVQLQKLMESEKLYLQRDLRSKDLADRLATSVHRLSQVLNERVGMSFPDFINNLRIEEAKKILAAGDDNKMETIALDMGFNNKVSFNKAFRKFTGVTPSQFKQQEQGNSSAA